MPLPHGHAGSANALEELKSHIATGNARPVLTEVLAALDRLLDSGEATTIDLGAFPFGPGDERLLDELLGPGEVTATIEALGRSIVAETGVPGVWRIDHFDERGETLSRFIEVTLIPDILKTQQGDAAQGRADLAERLAAFDARSPGGQAHD
ncbi:MAG: hypothetical protein D6801_06170 [Alphaproteobacteria bacterium]|nr:MAG: hypothetical protein D6801_06170 [Alphaproteobacteria bacterium]